MHRPALTALLAVALAAPALAADRYVVDTRHTQVLFSYSHFGYSTMSGQFHKVTGELQFDAADPARSSIAVTIPLDSLDTGVPELDADINGPNFFDAAQFPEASFKSTKIEKTGVDTFNASGDFTLHGVTRPIVLAVKLNKVGDHPMKKVPALGLEATTTLKRSDFGVTRMVPSVSDEVQVRINLEAQKPKT